MSGLTATFQRELRAYFYSPLAYVVATFMLVITGILFAVIIGFLNDPRFAAGRPLDLFFSMSWLILLVAAPLLTMRLVSEERKSGSIEVLMTAPVTEGQVVTGKYLAAFVFYCFLWLPTVLYAVLVEIYSEIDWGTVASGYVGVLSMGAMLLAVGLAASAFARSQIVAAMVTFAALVLFFFVFGWLSSLWPAGTLKEVFGRLDVLGPMDDFIKGIVDSRSLVYYLSTTVFFLFVASRALAAKKWR